MQNKYFVNNENFEELSKNLCSRNPVYGVSCGQENRLDVTNPHAERFFKKLKNRPAVGFGTGYKKRYFTKIVVSYIIVTRKKH